MDRFEILNPELGHGNFGVAMLVKRSVWREKWDFFEIFALCIQVDDKKFVVNFTTFSHTHNQHPRLGFLAGHPLGRTHRISWLRSYCESLTLLWTFCFMYNERLVRAHLRSAHKSCLLSTYFSSKCEPVLNSVIKTSSLQRSQTSYSWRRFWCCNLPVMIAKTWY